MTDSITPPPELVQQWYNASSHANEKALQDVATAAAHWGSDQELEACLANIHTMYGKDKADWLRAMRRPKPPTLKEQALQALSEAVKMADDVPPEGICSGQADIIRRALEQLDD